MNTQLANTITYIPTLLIERKSVPIEINIFGEKVTNNKIEVNKIYRVYRSVINLIKTYNIDEPKSTQIANSLIALKILEYKSMIIINFETLKENSDINYLIEYFLEKTGYEYLKDLFIDINYIPRSVIGKSLQLIEKMELYHFVYDNYFSINEILGSVFEKHINKKELGAYYTGKETTNYIVEKTIIPYFIDDEKIEIKQLLNSKKSLIKIVEENPKIISINKLKNIKILDPTCGSGAFIFSSYKLLKKLYKAIDFNLKDKELFNYIFKNNLFGIDLDNEAIELLKFRIAIESIQYKETNYEKLSENFIVGNTLIGSLKTSNNDSIEQDNENLYKLNQNGYLFPLIDKKNWIDKIKPLHLGKVFNRVLSQGGFDCIIGNPPYVEYSKTPYRINDYFSIKSGNLYAYVLERSINLLKKNGFIGMIIPISFISTLRMKSIREFFNNNLEFQFISSYADRPSSLFFGVHQKLNITIGKKSPKKTNSKIFTSSYLHWNKSDKHLLFNNVNYVENDIFTSNKFYYKIGNELEKSIVLKIINKSNKNIIQNTNQSGKNSVWLNMRLLFWNKAFLKEQQSKEYKRFDFLTKEYSTIFYSLINSNLFFFFWEIISDGWHITNKDLSNFKIDFSDFSKEDICEFEKINNELIINLETNKKGIQTKQTNFEYQHKKAKTIIDKLDLIFAKYYSFTEKEIEYLKFYNLKYRMNSELNNYLSINKYKYV